MCKVLVVIDMQNDFITGSLGSKEAQEIVKNVLNKINQYRKQKAEIVYTRDTHYANYLQTQEGSKLPVPHCIENTWGWQLQQYIEENRQKEEKIFDKNTFGSKELAAYISQKYIQDNQLEVELVGLCTDICVISNALLIKAYAPEIKLSIDASCCAGVTPESHQNALAAMTMCQINIQ